MRYENLEEWQRERSQDRMHHTSRSASQQPTAHFQADTDTLFLLQHYAGQL